MIISKLPAKRQKSTEATEIIPLKPKIRQRVPWENEDIAKKRRELKKVAKTKNSYPTRANKNKLKCAQKSLNDAYITEQTAYLQDKINVISSINDNKQAATAWKTVNEICGRKNANKAKIKASSNQERTLLWKQHFQNLLGKPPNIIDREIEQIIPQELDIKKGNFTMEELTCVLKTISNGKAPGLDDIPAEIWKTGEFNQELLDMCNAVYNQKGIDRWTQGCILPFPKKGDLGYTNNYRGITLTII